MLKLFTPSRLTSPEVKCLQSMDGWMDDLQSFSTVFQSYQDDERLT